MSTTRSHIVDDAISAALDTFVDLLLDGTDTAEAYDRLAADILAPIGAVPVMDFRFRDALLDDGTLVIFEPDMVRPSRSLLLRAILGIKVRLRDLPTPCSRGEHSSIETERGGHVFTWPINGRAVLRPYNDGAPTVTTIDGTRLWSPDDALGANDGVLLDGPTCQVTISVDWTATVRDLVESPSPGRAPDLAA